MEQEIWWLARYNDVISFIGTNHRNPSKRRIEEYDMLNWMKGNRKRINARGMKQERLEMFGSFLSLLEK